MPTLYSFIKKNVLFLSARNIYDKIYPNEPILWKASVMKYIMKLFNDPNKKKKVISVGDSIVESTAIMSVSKKLDMLDIKTVKFMDNPSINQLRYQLIYLNNSIKNSLNLDKETIEC